MSLEEISYCSIPISNCSKKGKVSFYDSSKVRLGSSDLGQSCPSVRIEEYDCLKLDATPCERSVALLRGGAESIKATDHKIQKPNLFISHAASDGLFARILEAELRKVFADGVDVFCTSSPAPSPPLRTDLRSTNKPRRPRSSSSSLLRPRSNDRGCGSRWVHRGLGRESRRPRSTPFVRPRST